MNCCKRWVQSLNIQNLTNDVQLLILCLSYYITTVPSKNLQPLTHSHFFFFCRIKRRSSGDNNLDTKSGVAGSSAGLVTSVVQAQVAPPSASCNVVLSPPPPSEVISTIQTTAAAVSSTTVGSVGGSSVSGMVATSSANLTTVVHNQRYEIKSPP